MIPKRLRLFAAGAVAFLLGIPLSEEVFAHGHDASTSGFLGSAFDIGSAALDLGFSIADVADGSS